MTLPSADAVERAAARIEPHITPTRLIRSDELSRRVGTDVYLKLENEQRTGSFKLRGALNVIGGLSAAERARGVVTSSAGNHGLGVATAAKQFGVKATIFIPSTAPRVKRDGIKAQGATVDEAQPHYDAAMVAATEFAAKQGAPFVHPCLGDALLAGQGTVALEILKELPDLETLIVPVGGGGLLGGSAGFMRERAPAVRIIGAQSENTAAMARSWRAGRVVEIENLPTLADGLAGQVDQAALDIGRAALSDIVTSTEDEIGRVMLWLLDTHGIKVEGSGAAGVAAILTGRVVPRGRTAIVVSGGNVDDDRLTRLRATSAVALPG